MKNIYECYTSVFEEIERRVIVNMRNIESFLYTFKVKTFLAIISERFSNFNHDFKTNSYVEVHQSFENVLAQMNQL